MIAVLAIPFFTAVLLLAFGRSDEKRATRLAALGTASLFVTQIFAVTYWCFLGAPTWDIELGDIYHVASYQFPMVLFVDPAAMVFSTLITLISTIIVRYCRYYLHREEGFGRFFATLFLFVSGMQLIALAGSLDLMFAGWEIVGVSSYLLIGFYRDRETPVRNAARVFTIYRVCDVGMLIGAWLSHLIWHQSQRFSRLAELASSPELASIGPVASFALGALLLLAACGKSAQFPFCSWVPRAMEGPTPSSAVFYGALSIHAGVFLLLRTYPLWSVLPYTPQLVAGVGLLTAVVATLVSRSQSNIKAQIGYASVAQVGLMLVELSLGLSTLAIFHMVGNAWLRCYQLLVSPSVVAHILRVHGASDSRLNVSDWSFERLLPNRLRTSLYILSFSEGYLEAMLRRLFRDSSTAVARAMQPFEPAWVRGLAPVMVLAIAGAAFVFPGRGLSTFSTFLMLIGSITAAGETSALRGWNAIGFSCVMAAISVFALDPHSAADLGVYLSGVVPAWLIGVWSFRHLGTDLCRYGGYVHTRPLAAWALFVGVLGLVGFPLTPTFLGEDLLLHHAAHGSMGLMASLTLAFVMNGISAIRLYTRLCLGPASAPAMMAQPAQGRGSDVNPRHLAATAVKPFKRSRAR